MTYKADYPYGSINPYRDKKAYTSQSDFYGFYMIIQGSILALTNLLNAS